MNWHEGNPRIQLVGQVDQVLRVVEQGLNQHPEKADENRHLHNERAEAADGINAAFPVQLHRFLGYALPVAGIAFLDLPHPGLKAGHGAHLAQLPHRQRNRHHAHQHGEKDDGQSHLGEAQDVQHQEGVEHRPDDDLSPEVTEYGKNLH